MTRDSDEFMKETIQNHTAEIKRFMQDQDVDAFGIARMADYGKEIVQLDKAFVEKFPFAISFGLVLSRSVMETVKEGPNALYLHHYRQLNYRLDMIAYLLSREIEKKGNRALPFAASQLVDWKNQKGHIPQKGS